MDELNGRMMACQILITGLIARVANDSRCDQCCSNAIVASDKHDAHALIATLNDGVAEDSRLETGERVAQRERQTVKDVPSILA